MMERESLAKQTDELKALIAEHPDYPIVVFAGEEANGGDYAWMLCSSVEFGVGKILDTDYFGYNDEIITDEDSLELIVEERLYDEGLEGEQLEKAIKDKIKELEPYWKDVIFIWATN